MLFYNNGLVHAQTKTPTEATTSRPSRILAYQATQAITRSTAQVLLKQGATTGLLNHCGMTFKHLQQSAQNAARSWDTKHQATTAKARKIKQYIYQNIADNEFPFAAEKLDLQIDAQIQEQIQQLIAQLVHNTRKRQHYLCNRLILSIAAGEWDLIKLIPEHQRRVIAFEIKR